MIARKRGRPSAAYAVPYTWAQLRADVARWAIKNAAFATGSPVDGPFDAIIFSGSVPSIPPALFDQLKNGARLIAVTGNGPGSKAVVWVRSGTSFAQREAFDATAAPLPGFIRAAQFVF